MKQEQVNELIKKVGLLPLWNSLDEDAKTCILDGMLEMYVDCETPPQGYYDKFNLMMDFCGFVTEDPAYEVHEKVYLFVRNVHPMSDKEYINLHFLYNTLGEYFYYMREKKAGSVEKAEEIFLKDMDAFESYSGPLMKKFGQMPLIPSFKQLAIMYEKAGRYHDAVSVCEKAIEYGLQDGTKMGYAGRVDKIKEKIKG